MAPASEIMPLFRAHKLHSGRSGKIVTNPKQANAIKLHYLCAEGRIAKKYCKGKKKSRSHKRVESKR
jgi:hypothetical protein